MKRRKFGRRLSSCLFRPWALNGCLEPADLAVKQKNVTHGVNRSSLCLTVFCLTVFVLRSFAFVFCLRDGESRSALVGRIDSTSRAQRQNTKAGSGENIEYIA